MGWVRGGVLLARRRFQQALLAHLSGSATALDDLVAQVHGLMPLVLDG
jgi:hypothetical protein